MPSKSVSCLLSAGLWLLTFHVVLSADQPENEVPNCKSVNTEGYDYQQFFHLSSSNIHRANGDRLSLKFMVQTYSNAHILLSSTTRPKEAEPVYEIVLGAASHSYSTLRPRRLIYDNYRVYTREIVSGTEFKGFWIRITNDGTILVGKEGADLPFLEYQDPKPLTINYISFSSWDNVTAKWLYDCPASDKTEPVTTSEPLPLVTTNKPLPPVTTSEPLPTVTTPQPLPPVLTAKPPTECQLSQTLVNRKAVCRGAVVFQDSFTTSSIAGHWQHVIKMADAPDYEFVTFTSDPVNSFHRDGKLVIKPSLLAYKDVQEGSISLDGCTGIATTRECEMTAFSYNILPPVRSARLNTRSSFNFRYGVVEIRARLPVGDWLVPELWLLPTDQSYGSNYLSGKVRVAMSRGNRYLNYNGSDIGSSTLESGLLVGLENDVREKVVINRKPDGWYTSPHNYTLVWTPDNLSFYVDGQFQQSLLPPYGSLTEQMGLAGRGVTAWSSGSRIAPFDTDFYLSLGLSAGGARDFPDGSVSGDNRKPWANFKLKAMLHFWLNRESWKPSWDEEKSSLIVEHVQVTAL